MKDLATNNNVHVIFKHPRTLITGDTLTVTWKLTEKGVEHVGTSLNGVELAWEYGRATGVSFLIGDSK